MHVYVYMCTYARTMSFEKFVTDLPVFVSY